jgi:hypothetical protein
VAGELLRLIAAHPQFELAGILSDSQPGEPVSKAFPHLAAVYRKNASSRRPGRRAAGTRAGDGAVLGTPHGVSAGLIDALLTQAEAAGARPHVVDISADFRYRTAEEYTASTSMRMARRAAGPVQLRGARAPADARHAPRGAPGCFATSILLASVPLLARGLAVPELFVSAVTGSTGSGRKPVEGRTIRRATTICTPITRSRTAIRRRSPPRGGGLQGERALRVRAALRSIRARHPCDGAGHLNRKMDSAALLAHLREFTASRSYACWMRRRASRTSPAATMRTSPR